MISAGVGGKEGSVEDVGVGLAESLLEVLGATGKLIDNRFGLGLYDMARECFVMGRGGGDMAKYALFGEFPTWGEGGAAGCPDDFKIDSTEARSTDDVRR